MARHEIVTGWVAAYADVEDAASAVYLAAQDWCLPGVTVARAGGWAAAWGGEPVLVITVLMPEPENPCAGLPIVIQFAKALRERFRQDAVLHTWHEVQGGLL
jgi:hypothetical protein